MTTVRAANAAEFLSFLPRLLGCHPVESLVIVPFDGTRSIGAMRLDLPPDDTDDLDAFASTIVGMACRVADADAVAVVVYSGASIGAGDLPHRALFDALARRVDASGLGLSDGLCVAADGWGSFFEPDPAGPVRPLDDLETLEVSGESAPRGDQESGAALPEVGVAERGAVADAVNRLAAAADALCAPDAARPRVDPDPPLDPRGLADAAALDDLPLLFEQSLDWNIDALDPADAAALLWCLNRPALRDIALVQWVGGAPLGDEAFDAQLRWAAGEEYPPHLACFLWGEGDIPDPSRLVAALALTRRLAAVAPFASTPGALATAAWLSWALGRSSHAAVHAAAAVAAEPDHGLASIVLSFVEAGHLPDWAFRSRRRAHARPGRPRRRRRR